MDPILYWNEVALEANRVSFTTERKSNQARPHSKFSALAIVDLAMYDAYAGVQGNPVDPVDLSHLFLGLPSPKPNASANAAVAAAAHATLSSFYPSQKSFFNLKHTQAGFLRGDGVEEVLMNLVFW